MKHTQLKKLLKGCGMEHLLGKGYALEPLPDPVAFSREYREEGQERPSKAQRKNAPRRVIHDETGVVVGEFPNEASALAFINESVGDYAKAVKEATEIFEEGSAVGMSEDARDALRAEAAQHLTETFPSLNTTELRNATLQAEEAVFGPDPDMPEIASVQFGAGKITMTKKQFLKEHRNLLKVLKEAKPKALKKEYEEQKKEMKGLTGGAYRAIQIEVPQTFWTIEDTRTGEHYKEGDNVPIFELRSEAEQYIADIVSGAVQQRQEADAERMEDEARAGTPPRGAQQRQPPPAPRRGRGKFGLTKGQHSHLKKELTKFGEAVDVDTLLAHLNSTAKKPQQHIESADKILEYVRAKASAPDNEHWSITGDKYVRYTGSGLTGKGDDDEEGLVYKSPLPPVRKIDVSTPKPKGKLPKSALEEEMEENLAYVRSVIAEKQRLPPAKKGPELLTELGSPPPRMRERRRGAVSPVMTVQKDLPEIEGETPIEYTIRTYNAAYKKQPSYEPLMFFANPLYFPFASPEVKKDLIRLREAIDASETYKGVGFKPFDPAWYDKFDTSVPGAGTVESDYAGSPKAKTDLKAFLVKRASEVKKMTDYLKARPDLSEGDEELAGKGYGSEPEHIKEFLRKIGAPTKTGSGKLTHRLSFLKKHKLPPHTPLSIEEIAKVSGYPVKTLQEVYNRGIGAYKTNPESVRLEGSFKKDPKAPLSKKLSKEQWAMARVYSFVDGNKKHDADLR
jgi:hypothetical protein